MKKSIPRLDRRHTFYEFVVFDLSVALYPGAGSARQRSRYLVADRIATGHRDGYPIELNERTAWRTQVMFVHSWREDVGEAFDWIWDQWGRTQKV